MTDFTPDSIRAQREIAAARAEIERQTARAEAAERERDALRANAEAAQHIDRAVLDTILEVMGGEG